MRGIILSLFLVGCSGTSHGFQHLKMPAHLNMANVDDSVVVAGVALAAHEWYTATDGTVDLLAGDGQSIPVSLEDLTDEDRDGEAAVLAKQGHFFLRIDDTVAVRYTFQEVKAICLHEIGHVLGLHHTTNGIMNQKPSDQSSCIDADALAKVCKRYGCGSNAKATCK